MRTLFHSIVIMSFLLGIIAPACGFMWGGKASFIEICTAQGIEKRFVTAQAETPPMPPSHIMDDSCSFCFQSNHVAAFLAPSSKGLYDQFQKEKRSLALYRALLLNKQRLLPNPRAPPILT